MFRNKNRTGGDLVLSASNALRSIVAANGKGSTSSKVTDELGKNLSLIKGVMCDDDIGDFGPDAVSSILAEIYREDFLTELAVKVSALDWEIRKNVVHIWYALFQPLSPFAELGVLYVENHQEVLSALLQGYEVKSAAISTGAMLRETLRHPRIARCFLRHPDFPFIFTFIDVSSFDVASDAFMTLKDALRKHTDVASVYFSENYLEFFELYERLLTSENYVTRRQSVKLLGEILLDRANVSTMLRFINDSHNLRLIMTLLKDESKNIQFEAFHVFKVFVANPSKAEGIVKLLSRNREKLLEFLENFHNDREDEEFQEEKQLLVKEIHSLL